MNLKEKDVLMSAIVEALARMDTRVLRIVYKFVLGLAK